MKFTAQMIPTPGQAILPWWLNSRKAITNAWHELGDKRLLQAIRDDECVNIHLITQHVTVYAVRYANPDRIEWLTREAYCLRALELLCETLKAERGPAVCLRIRRSYKIYTVSVVLDPDQVGPGAAAKTLEDACTSVLGELDPLWRNRPS